MLFSGDDRIALAGRLLTPSGAPALDRPFVIVDRDGDRRDDVSGPEGELFVEELRPPYDLRVGDVAFLGVTRPDPVIVVDVASEERHVVTSRALTLALELPSCGRTPCVVEVVSRSPTGSGRLTLVAPRPGATNVEMSWRHDARDPTEPVEVVALAHDTGFTTAAYGRAVVDSREPRHSPTLTLGLVATREARVEPEAELTLDIPIASGLVASFAITERIPQVPGASWRFERRAAATPTSTLVHRSTRVWSGSLALGEEPPSLPLLAGPELRRPSPGGTVSASAGLAWSPEPRALFEADVVDRANGVFRYRLVTNESDLTFDRLERLGLARLRAGAHTLTLTTSQSTSIDDLTSPDASIRTRRLDRSHPGASTHETIAFTAHR